MATSMLIVGSPSAWKRVAASKPFRAWISGPQRLDQIRMAASLPGSQGARHERAPGTGQGELAATSARTVCSVPAVNLRKGSGSAALVTGSSHRLSRPRLDSTSRGAQPAEIISVVAPAARAGLGRESDRGEAGLKGSARWQLRCHLQTARRRPLASRLAPSGMVCRGRTARARWRRRPGPPLRCTH